MNKIEGIGSFVITAQLCYEDINSNSIYWLNKNVKFTVKVYEDLKNISVYEDYAENAMKYIFEPKPFSESNLSFDENLEETKYLFLNSQTMQIFKNYIKYNQIEVFAEQIFENSLLSFP